MTGRMRLLTVFAALAEVAIAALIPLSWYLTARSRLHNELEVHAQMYAASVVEEARRNPAFRDALTGRSVAIVPDSLAIVPAPKSDDQEVVPEERRIYSRDARVLIDTATASPPETPLFAVRLPVMDGATRLGTVEVVGSLRPTVVLTVGVACGSTGLGLILFMLLRVQPMRMLATANDRATFLAANDLLTGLPNRQVFQQKLEQALHRGGQVAVLYVDIDHFTTINDLLGHAAADHVLRTVAERLRGCIRGDDTLARLGGDQFGVIQCGLGCPDDSDILGHRLLAAMHPPIEIDGRSHEAGISVGVAVSDRVAPGTVETDRGEQLMKRADMALHQAKQEGRGRICAFSPDMTAKLRERVAMESDLRLAIAEQRLVLHYQPQVDLQTGRIRGAEALVRWNRPGHGMVPPDRFIGLAEENGLIVPIGEWVLREACRRAVTWPAYIGIAVNVSIVQLRQPGFCQTVIDVLHETGITPSRLELELTETVLMQDNAETLATLQRLRRLGIKLAMDDFGTGYSSLGYLQTFRFDKIKIDRSFVSRMGDDTNANAIVRAVVVMTEALGVRANAEGVETPAQANALRAAGCAEAQGYLYSRPLPGEAFDVMMEDSVLGYPPREDGDRSVAVSG